MDDFSFPSIAAPDHEDPLCGLPFPHFAASPLWFFSSGSDVRRQRSLPSLGDAGVMRRDPELASADGGSRRFLDEERMDMLWEDLNDEGGRASCDQQKAATKLMVGNKRRGASMSTEHQTPLLEAKSGGLVHRRRPSLILMVKVLKKLILIQKAASSKKQSLYTI